DNFTANLDVVERLRREIADPRGVPLSQVALAWVLGHPAVSTALVGARTPAEVDANDAGAELELSPAERAKIDAILAGVAGRVREFTPLRPAMEVWGEEIAAGQPGWNRAGPRRGNRSCPNREERDHAEGAEPGAGASVRAGRLPLPGARDDRRARPALSRPVRGARGARAGHQEDEDEVAPALPVGARDRRGSAHPRHLRGPDRAEPALLEHGVAGGEDPPPDLPGMGR